MSVGIEFDNGKDAINRAKHGLPLKYAQELFTGDFKEKLDQRKDYGEIRIIATGPIGGRICVCVYTWRDGIRRIISLRKANEEEIDDYHKT